MESDLKRMRDDKVLIKHNWDTAFAEQFTILFDEVLEATNPEYITKFGKRHKELRDRGYGLYQEFHQSWLANSGSMEKDIETFSQNAQAFADKCIPHIDECISFWQEVLNNRHLFLASPEGTSKLSKLELCFNGLPSLKIAIEQLLTDHHSDPTMDSIRLLDAVQKEFDCVALADIQYKNEFEMSTISVKAAPDSLAHNVLQNIKNNIVSHAFSTQSAFSRHFHFNNVIQISCKVLEDTVEVRIANNGEPFKGNVSKLGINGYFFGENGHSGHGLYSAKISMQEMGGDLNVEIPKDGPFTFTYIITLQLAR